MGAGVRRFAVSAVLGGLVASAVAFAPATSAETIGARVTADLGCHPNVLGRGATLTGNQYSVYLTAHVSGLSAGTTYTVDWRGDPALLARYRLGTADAEGVVALNQVELRLPRALTSTAPRAYDVRDGAGTVVDTGSMATVVRPGSQCARLSVLQVAPALTNPGGTGAYRLSQQTDGNIVERDAMARAVWSSGTAGHPGATTTLQTDGNLVIRDARGRAIWNTGTAGHAGATLTLQTDSNVVLRDATGRAIWVSGMHR